MADATRSASLSRCVGVPMLSRMSPIFPRQRDADARFPILLRAGLAPEELLPGDLVLLDARVAEPPVPAGVTARSVAFAPVGADHGAGCTCCAAHSPLARTLASLVVERARGEVPFFARLVAVSDAAGRAALRASVRADPLVGSRYSV